MTLGKLALITSVATLLGAASPVLADEMSTGPDDSTGMSSLGIDISGVGGSQQAVGNFLASLSPDAQRGVLGGCQTAVGSGGSGYSPAVVGFCQTALNIGPMSGPALGYAPAQSGFFAPSPIIENRDVLPDATIPLGDVPPVPGQTVDH